MDGIVDAVDGCPSRAGDAANNGCPADGGPPQGPHDVPRDPDSPPTAPPDDEEEEWDCGPLLKRIHGRYDTCMRGADKAWGLCKAEAKDAADLFWEAVMRRCNRNKTADEDKCATERDDDLAVLPPSCDG